VGDIKNDMPVQIAAPSAHSVAGQHRLAGSTR
jgi:hypothetical protein